MNVRSCGPWSHPAAVARHGEEAPCDAPSVPNRVTRAGVYGWQVPPRQYNPPQQSALFPAALHAPPW